MPEESSRVLVIASDTIGAKMAGSGIRYWNIASHVATQHPVTLAAPGEVDLDPPEGVEIVSYDVKDQDAAGNMLSALIERHDIVIAQHLPYLYTDANVLSDRFLIVDLYAPWILEKLEYARIDPERGEPDRADDLEILQRLLQLGDFFICASERQRDFWLGALSASGRLSLEHAQKSPDLRYLIDVVGFGLPDSEPELSGAGPRDLFPSIGPATPIILWNGGIWNWLDPLTAIRAVGELDAQGVTVALVFLGVRSPGAQVADMSVVDEARSLAGELDLLERCVFFNDWVPFEERQNWMLESAATLSLHTATAESRYAYRTRVLDNLWCETPLIVTEGDILAEIAQNEEIGVIVPPGDPEAVAAAIERVIDPANQAAYRRRIRSIAPNYRWDRVLEPLLARCADPWRPSNQKGSDDYLQKLERLYTETAQYARQLEQAIEEKDEEIARLTGQASRSPLRRITDRFR